ncbi:MAG TPA: zf-HC2 domain-containing protein [Bryobacteraceae bacterium]|nr:zf-HC2 domain-containing protein [Bryobacteraceae bacterium]
MNCKDWEERLALYAGGDLPPDQAAAVERHLGECPGCQLFSSGLKEAGQRLAEWHGEPLPAAHFAAVRARVLAELERQRRPFWRRGWAYGVAAAVMAALLVLLAVKPRPPVLQPPAVAIDRHPQPAAPEPAADRPAPQPIRPAATPIPRKRHASQPGEQVLIRVVSNDPDVVIYWIADTRGE